MHTTDLTRDQILANLATVATLIQRDQPIDYVRIEAVLRATTIEARHHRTASRLIAGSRLIGRHIAVGA